MGFPRGRSLILMGACSTYTARCTYVKAVKARLLYTGRPGLVLHDVYVVFDEGFIKSVQHEEPEGASVLGEFDVVTPAFIDAHCHIGLARSGEPIDEEETNEKLDPLMSMADAVNAVYMDDKAFEESIEHGVLYSCVLPGSGNIIGGKAAVIRNYGKCSVEAFIRYAGVKAALGYNPRSTVEWKGSRPYTRMGVVALLEEALQKALDSKKLVDSGKKALEEIEPRIRALFPVIEGREVLRVHVHKADDIMVLLKLREKYGLKVTVEHACDVHEKWVFEKLRDEGVPLVYGPVDAFAYKTELKHESYRNVRLVVEARPKMCLMTDHPVVLQRNLLLQLRFFLRFGMKRDEALALITSNAAEILGVSDVIGSIEEGKWASLVCWSGDPFSLESYPQLVLGEGRVLHQE